jgi:DNA-binding transcriptional LysR family regulator
MFEKLFARRGLSLDRLRVLCEVAEAGGIARAARNDPTRQSQFSRQLKELEDFFEVELTRRQGKGLGLTPAGRELALHARELLQGLQDFQLRWINQPLTYSIGAGESLLAWLLLPNMSQTAEAALASNFKLRNLRTTEIVSGLQDLSLDFGLIRKDAATQPLATHPLGKLEYALYCPKELLKKSDSYDLVTVLQNVPLALLGSDGEFVRDFHAWVKKNQVSISVKLECDSFPQACRAIKTGQYATILPTIAARDLPPGEFVEVALPLKKGSRVICLAWNPRILRLRTPAPKVAEFLKEALRF